MVAEARARGPMPARRRAATGPTLRARGLAAVVLAVGGAARLARRGSGAVIGGRVALLVDRRAVATLSAWRTRILCVSATNGKTTTTAFLAAAMEGTGRLVTNSTGANLATGVVSALAGDLAAGTAVLEVDEAALPRILAETAADVVVLLNLTRDQLDRYGEVRMTADRWRAALRDATGAIVVANVDDPLVVWAASAATDVVWVEAGTSWLSDATTCPSCGDHIEIDGRQWRSACGFARPDPAVRLDDEGRVVAGDRVLAECLRLALPGRFNIGNAVAALAAADAAGADPAVAAAAMASVDNVRGRYGLGTVGGRAARLLLAKNPAGWTALLDEVAGGDRPLVVAINARIADGKDTSWLWDVPFERLAGRRVVAAGDRAHDLGLRLHYAGVDADVVPGPVPAAMARAGHGDVVDVIANYTAFQDALRGRT